MWQMPGLVWNLIKQRFSMERIKIIDEKSRDEVIRLLRKLSFNKPYVVIVDKFHEQRSISQNKLYWLWLTCLMDETGNSRVDLHKYFKETFIPSQVEEINGIEIVKSGSTTSLNTKEFKFYLERVHQFAMEYNIYLPWPEDGCFEEFEFKYKKYI